MAGNTSAGFSATLMKQYWNEEFIKELRSKLVLRDLGQMGKVPGGNGRHKLCRIISRYLWRLK